MFEFREIVVFCVDSIKFATPVSSIEYIIQAVEIMPLPGAPDLLSGILNYHGEIIPVINFRGKLKLKERTVCSQDFIIIANTGKRKIAFVVDEITGYREINNSDIKDIHTIWQGISRIESIVSDKEDYIIITDFEHFLSGEEESSLVSLLPDIQKK